MSQNLTSKVFLHFEEAQIWISDLFVAISLQLLFTNYKLTSHWHSRHAAGCRRWAWESSLMRIILPVNHGFPPQKVFPESFSCISFLTFKALESFSCICFSSPKSLQHQLPSRIKTGLKSQLHFRAKSTAALSEVLTLDLSLSSGHQHIFSLKLIACFWKA